MPQGVDSGENAPARAETRADGRTGGSGVQGRREDAVQGASGLQNGRGGPEGPGANRPVGLEEFLGLALPAGPGLRLFRARRRHGGSSSSSSTVPPQTAQPRMARTDQLAPSSRPARRDPFPLPCRRTPTTASRLAHSATCRYTRCGRLSPPTLLLLLLTRRLIVPGCR